MLSLFCPWPETKFASITCSLDRDKFKQMGISSCEAGLVLNMGWNGDHHFVVYGFVNQANPCNLSPLHKLLILLAYCGVCWLDYTLTLL